MPGWIAGGANWRHLPWSLSLRPFPPEVVVPIGPPLLSLPDLHALPSPRCDVPPAPPDRPCFAAPCRAHTEEGNSPHGSGPFCINCRGGVCVCFVWGRRLGTAQNPASNNYLGGEGGEAWAIYPTTQRALAHPSGGDPQAHVHMYKGREGRRETCGEGRPTTLSPRTAWTSPHAPARHTEPLGRRAPSTSVVQWAITVFSGGKSIRWPEARSSSPHTACHPRFPGPSKCIEITAQVRLVLGLPCQGYTHKADLKLVNG